MIIIKIWGAIVGSLALTFIIWAATSAPPVKPMNAAPEKTTAVVAKPAAAPTPAVVPVKAATPINNAELIARGKTLYFSNCISCHNKDPNIKGGIGPEMVDAPLEVMTSKVMTGLYPATLPPGFVPKRKTKMMKKIVKLEKDIPAIHAWVQSVKKKK